MAHGFEICGPLCSNPMAGMDATLLALAGTGYADSRSFGFASCERAVGAAEGMNVLAEHQLQRPGGGTEWGYNVTNIEYTEFERLGVTDQPAEGSQFSRFPANTNVLYIGLKVNPSPVSSPPWRSQDGCATGPLCYMCQRPGLKFCIWSCTGTAILLKHSFLL